jgi:hypothetical protein
MASGQAALEKLHPDMIQTGLEQEATPTRREQAEETERFFFRKFSVISVHSCLKPLFGIAQRPSSTTSDKLVRSFLYRLPAFGPQPAFYRLKQLLR